MWKAFLFSWAYGYLGRLFGRLFGDSAERAEFETLVQTAEPIVVGLMTQDISGDQKRKQAVESLKVLAVQKGLPLVEHLLNLAVEMAVAAAKKNK